MSYEEVQITTGAFVQNKYKQKPSIVDIPKGKIRKKINEEIFDPEDSIADNAKMLFLILSMIKRLYDVNFDVNALSDEDKNIIEYALNEYVGTETRMDLQFQEEGIGLIDKLLDRQKKVAEVIKEVTNE